MMRRLPLLLVLCCALPLQAQEPPRGAPRVFLDCSGFGCDEQFFRMEIDWVRYVRDRQDADVHLLITRQRTGGGGQEYSLDFIGQGAAAGQQFQLRYASPQTATEDEERRGLAHSIRLGLAPFLAATSAARGLRMTYEAPEGADEAELAGGLDDPWNFWTFRAGVGGSFDGEASRSEWDLDGSFEAERVTADWKIELGAEGRQSQGRFEVDSTTTVHSEEHQYEAGALVVRSLGAHWSAGGRSEVERSTRLNQDLTVRLAPAIEYSVYPYELFNRRQITFLYSAGLSYFDYAEETIFGELSEALPNHSLRGGLELNQPWGEVDVSLEARQFLHDPERFSLELFNRLDVRVLRGLNVSASGGISYIRDQLFLPAGEVDPEEVLLNLRALETNYEYHLSLGLSYTFGSIYSTVVNPRF